MSPPSRPMASLKEPSTSWMASAFSARMSAQRVGFAAPTRVRSRKEGPAKERGSGEVREGGGGGDEPVVALRVHRGRYRAEVVTDKLGDSRVGLRQRVPRRGDQVARAPEEAGACIGHATHLTRP